MPFVQAKCTNCGANLEVDNSKDAAICPYCHTPYVVEKAINNYNTTNNTFNSIHADNLNIEFEKEFVIKAGELVEYNGAAVDVEVPEGVYKIGNAFKQMKYLHSVKLPNTIKEIGGFAFLGCSNLEYIACTSSIGQIVVGEGAFNGCYKLKLPPALDFGNYPPANTYVCPVCGCEIETDSKMPNDYKCPQCQLPGKLFYLKHK